MSSALAATVTVAAGFSLHACWLACLTCLTFLPLLVQIYQGDHSSAAMINHDVAELAEQHGVTESTMRR